MKYNISDVMEELRPGHVLIDADGNELIFIEAKKVTALVANKATGKRYCTKGIVEVTTERDQEWVDLLEEEVIMDMIGIRKTKKMKIGQHFIGQDGLEYILTKITNTQIRCKSADETNAIASSKDFRFIKDVLGKITEQGKKGVVLCS